MPAEGRENPLLKKGNSDAFFREKYLTKNKHAKYGWTVTTLAPEAEAWIRKTLGEDKINASRLPVEGTTKGGSKKSINRSIKYVCPCCGTIIRATREVNVICGDCGEAFERE